MEREYASKGVAGAGLGLGIAGTALGLMNGGNFGGLFNGTNNCSENQAVNRFELNMQNEITNKDMEIAFLRGQNFTNEKIADLADRVNTRFTLVERRISDLETYSAVNTTTIGCMKNQIEALQGLTKLVVPSSNVCNQDYPVVVTNTACNPVYTQTVTA